MATHAPSGNFSPRTAGHKTSLGMVETRVIPPSPNSPTNPTGNPAAPAPRPPNPAVSHHATGFLGRRLLPPLAQHTGGWGA